MDIQTVKVVYRKQRVGWVLSVKKNGSLKKKGLLPLLLLPCNQLGEQTRVNNWGWSHQYLSCHKPSDNSSYAPLRVIINLVDPQIHFVSDLATHYVYF